MVYNDRKINLQKTQLQQKESEMAKETLTWKKKPVPIVSLHSFQFISLSVLFSIPHLHLLIEAAVSAGTKVPDLAI